MPLNGTNHNFCGPANLNYHQKARVQSHLGGGGVLKIFLIIFRIFRIVASDIISQAANDVYIFHNVYFGNCKNLNDDLKILKILRNILKILKIIRNIFKRAGLGRGLDRNLIVQLPLAINRVVLRVF